MRSSTAIISARPPSIRAPAPSSGRRRHAGADLRRRRHAPVGHADPGHGSWSGSWSSVQAAINTGSAVPGVPFVNNCAAPSVCATLRATASISRTKRAISTIARARAIFSAQHRMGCQRPASPELDGQRITASTYNNDILVATGSMANTQYSVNGDGTPQVKLLPGSNVNYASGRPRQSAQLLDPVHPGPCRGQ